MYLEHFGLKERPFSLNPDPSYLYLSSQHSLAYHTLEYGLLSQTGITVISGEVGAGKTTLLRHLLNQHDEGDLVVGLIADTQQDTAKRLMSWIAMAFDLEPSADEMDMKKHFQQFLIDNYAMGKTAVLIVDEAQNLGNQALEQLRLLNNINTAQDELLKIILVGQPELLVDLQRPELMQLAQRVTVEYHLCALKVQEAQGYILHRMKVAGAGRQRFTKAAVYGIYYLTGGVPRLINTLCDHSMLCAYSRGEEIVGLEAALTAARNRKIGGVNIRGGETEDQVIARSYVLQTTGHDVALLQP